MYFQGLDGVEGPVGEQGYDGCNGTKVSKVTTSIVSHVFFSWYFYITVGVQTLTETDIF